MKKQENTKSKSDSELEHSKKHFDKLYKENQGKIPNTFPKTIFDLLKKKEKRP